MTHIDPRRPSPRYYYLWHLVSLGVMTPDPCGEELKQTIWDELAEMGATSPSTVVMIDVGCRFDHPNLRGRVDHRRSIDFSISPYGTRFSNEASDRPAPVPSNFSGLDLGRLNLDALNSDDLGLLQEIAQDLIESNGLWRGHGDVERIFSSHGTAASGLIVGGPEILGPEQEPHAGAIPYFGVDPYSHLISVRTGFDDDPAQFISALLYAWNQAADVIVLPRGLPDPVASYMTPKDDFGADLERWANRDHSDLLGRMEALQATAETVSPLHPQRGATKARLWRILRQIFIAVSKHIPIVCAAGNDGESQLNYPASLASRENGVIAVGAVTANGLRAGYSNYGDGLSLVAPSDDMQVFNRYQLRDVPKTRERLKYLCSDDVQQLDYSHLGLLTTDIPGRFGYDAGRAATGDPDDRASPELQTGLYTQFGGTSGAAALVAGVVALIRRAERARSDKGGPLDGCDIKKLLCDTARQSLPLMQDQAPLKGDRMNSASEDADTFEAFFGCGLVDARAAIDAIIL